MMASLNSRQECSPVEALHTSQGGRSFGVRRAGQVQNSDVWVLASWNVRTLLDVEGPIETARQKWFGSPYMSWELERSWKNTLTLLP